MKTTRILWLAAGAIGMEVGCATLIGLTPSDQPACTDPADQTALGQHQATFVADVVGCAVAHMGDLGAASACIQAKDGLSQPCAECSASNGVCAMAACGGQCVGGAGSIPCRECMATQCNATLVACAGTPVYACVGPSDTAALTKHMSTLEMDVKTCGLTNASDPNAIASCIAKADELSLACAVCYVQTGVCAASECSTPCVNDPASDACNACVGSACAPAFALCSGVPYGDGGPG